MDRTHISNWPITLQESQSWGGSKLRELVVKNNWFTSYRYPVFENTSLQWLSSYIKSRNHQSKKRWFLLNQNFKIGLVWIRISKYYSKLLKSGSDLKWTYSFCSGRNDCSEFWLTSCKPQGELIFQNAWWKRDLLKSCIALEVWMMKRASVDFRRYPLTFIEYLEIKQPVISKRTRNRGNPISYIWKWTMGFKLVSQLNYCLCQQFPFYAAQIIGESAVTLAW